MAFGNRVRLSLAISMPQDGSVMPISFVPLKGCREDARG